MNKKLVLTVFCLLLALNMVSCSKKIYYLYENEAQQDKLTLQTLKKNQGNHPVIAVDCKKHNCEKFKAPHYPALIFWNGAGTSYKSLYPTNAQGLQAYFKGKQEHIFKGFRDFMQRISLIQSFGLAFIVATVLYLIFSALFKDRSGLQEAKSKKDR